MPINRENIYDLLETLTERERQTLHERRSRPPMKMKDYREIVKTLSGVDGGILFSGDVKRTLVECFKSIGIMTHTLHKGYTIARVRCNSSKPFTQLAELSYRPIHIPGKTQRANTRETTRFYGASCERRCPMPVTEEEYGIKVALFETLPALRENSHHGFGLVPPQGFPDFFISPYTSLSKVRVTYSIWETINDINLASVAPQAVHDGDFGTQYLSNHIIGAYIRSVPFDRVTEDVFWNFLTAKFASLGIPTSHRPDYLVSSIASELLSERGFHGVSYPSTRCNGLGINIAVTPEVADERLICKKVGVIDVRTEANILKLEYINTAEISQASGIRTGYQPPQ